MQVQCLQNIKIQDIAQVWPQIRMFDSLKIDGVVNRLDIKAVADHARGLCFDVPAPNSYPQILGNAFGGDTVENPLQLAMSPVSNYLESIELPQGHMRLDYTKDVITQLAALCRINKTDLENEAEKYPDIAAKRINTWMRDHEVLNYGRKKERYLRQVRHLVRAYSTCPQLREQFGTPYGVMRAIRSDQFKLGMDASDILGVLLKVLEKKRGQWEKVSVEISISDQRCYFVVNNYSLQEMNAVGDLYCASFVGSTSDIGSGSLSLESRAVKLACMNGMKTGHSIRKAHLGKKLEKNIDHMFSDRTFQLQQATLMSELYDVMCYCFDENGFIQIIEKVNENLGLVVTKEEAKNVFECVQVSMGLSDSVKDQLFEQFLQERKGDSQNNTKDGIIQAVTHIGRQTGINKDYSDAVSFEEMGGKLHSMERDLFANLVKVEPKKGARILDKAEIKAPVLA